MLVCAGSSDFGVLKDSLSTFTGCRKEHFLYSEIKILRRKKWISHQLIKTALKD